MQFFKKLCCSGAIFLIPVIKIQVVISSALSLAFLEGKGRGRKNARGDLNAIAPLSNSQPQIEANHYPQGIV
jgi:hypothetical protein